MRVNVFACEDWVCNKYSHDNSNNNNNNTPYMCDFTNAADHISRVAGFAGYDFVVLLYVII